ncbi:Uncharacterised protein [Serratia fonticola]|uniref:TetR family transcriptional regulator n=1 Tax=Serratia fonticola TaxID=47917 RepID=A0A4U9TMX8_SERFO|nr:Uncharacterised protein [Serratia fonticola]
MIASIARAVFTGLTVADHQLTLATTDWDHGVDRFVAGLYWLINRLTFDNAQVR